MPRSVKEWIGSSDDAKVPAHVKLRIFEREKGICWLSGRKIGPADQWELDHKIALCNGGEHRESNLFPALRDKHREKTKLDVAERSETRSWKSRQIGIRKKSTFPGSRDSAFKKCMDGRVVRRSTTQEV